MQEGDFTEKQYKRDTVILCSSASLLAKQKLKWHSLNASDVQKLFLHITRVSNLFHKSYEMVYAEKNTNIHHSIHTLAYVLNMKQTIYTKENICD